MPKERFVFFEHVLRAPVDDCRSLLYNLSNKQSVILKNESIERILQNDPSAVAHVLRHDLQQKHYLRSSENPQALSELLAYQILEAPEPSRAMTLSIQTTLDCNCRCSYCFQAFDRAQQGTAVMSRTTADHLVAWIKQNIEQYGYREFIYYFMGGEVTLAADLLSYLGKNLVRQTQDCGAQSYCHMNSNGVDLTVDLVKRWADEFNLKKIAISIDGNATLHNARRPLKDGGDSFAKTFANIKAITASECVSVALLTTMDPNHMEDLEHIKAYLRLLVDEGIAQRDVKVSFGFTTRFNVVLDRDHNESVLRRKLQELYQTAEEYGLKMGDALSLYTPGFCNAFSKNSMTITPSGDVYACEFFQGMEAHKLGNINQLTPVVEMDQKLIGLKQKLLLALQNSQCFSCPYLFYCGIGCLVRFAKEDVLEQAKPTCLRKIFEGAVKQDMARIISEARKENNPLEPVAN